MDWCKIEPLILFLSLKQSKAMTSQNSNPDKKQLKFFKVSQMQSDTQETQTKALLSCVFSNSYLLQVIRTSGTAVDLEFDHSKDTSNIPMELSMTK